MTTLIFNARSIFNQFLPHDAMLAWYMSSLCVCLSVLLTPVLCQMAKHRIMQAKPYDRPSLMPKITVKFKQAHPLQRDKKHKWGRLKIGQFQQIIRCNLKTVQDRCIVSINNFKSSQHYSLLSVENKNKTKEEFLTKKGK